MLPKHLRYQAALRSALKSPMDFPVTVGAQALAFFQLVQYSSLSSVAQHVRDRFFFLTGVLVMPIKCHWILFATDFTKPILDQL